MLLTMGYRRTKAIPNTALERRRKELGLSQPALARLVGCQQSQISKLERGEAKTTVEWTRRLAGPLNCDPRDLFASPDEEELPPYRSPTGPARTDETLFKLSMVGARELAVFFKSRNVNDVVDELAPKIYDVLVGNEKELGVSVTSREQMLKIVVDTIKRLWPPPPATE